MCDALESGGDGDCAGGPQPGTKVAYGCDALSRPAQRRTTSHRSKRHRRRPNLKRPAAEASGDPLPLCRQARRRKKFQDVRNSVPVGGGATYLETHKWYAKRQKMVQVWNHFLPQGARGKGLGLAGFCHRLAAGVAVHDMSYYWSFSLRGPFEHVAACLGNFCDREALPGGPGALRPREQAEQRLTFHRKGQHPRQILSPLMITWRCEQGGGSGSGKAADASKEGPCSALLWVHCHAYSRVKDELAGALQGQSELELSCLENRIKRVEMRGAKADEILAESLLVPKGTFGGEGGAGEGGAGSSGGGGDAAWRAGACQAASLNLLDPRLLAILQKAASFYPEAHYQGKMRDLTRFLSSQEMGPVERFEGRPISEAELGNLHRKANLLQDVFGILVSEHGKSVGCPVTVIATPSGRGGDSSGDRRREKALGGYSFLLPGSWVHSLWMPLIRLGAAGVGLREWKWHAQLCGDCVFPDSFPDLEGLNKADTIEYTTNIQLQARERACPGEAAAHWLRPLLSATGSEGEEGRGIGGNPNDAFVARSPSLLRPFASDVAGGVASYPGDPGCLVRALLLPAKRGTMDSWSTVFKASQRDVDRFLGKIEEDCGEEEPEGRGEGRYDLKEERVTMGCVTLGVLPKKVKGFADIRAEVFCRGKAFWDAMAEQQGTGIGTGGAGEKAILVMLLCKNTSGNAGTLRPAFAKLCS